MGIFSKQATAERLTSSNVGRARDRASKLSNQDLVAWAESVEMNLGHAIAVGLRQGDETAIHEALVMNESLHGMLLELAERLSH